jgi:hypothetical protein
MSEVWFMKIGVAMTAAGCGGEGINVSNNGAQTDGRDLMLRSFCATLSISAVSEYKIILTFLRGLINF